MLVVRPDLLDCGERGVDDGVHAQHDARISAIMKSSWASIASWSGYGLVRSASILPKQARVLEGVRAGRLYFPFVVLYAMEW